MRFRHVAVVGVALGLAALLSGCGVSVSLMPQSTCEKLVSPDALDDLADAGLTLDDAWPRSDDPLAEVYSAFGEAGGASCRWSSGDEEAIYSAAPMTEQQLSAAQDSLLELGYTPTDTGDERYYLPPDGSAILFVAGEKGLYGVAGEAHLDDLVEY